MYVWYVLRFCRSGSQIDFPADKFFFDFELERLYVCP